MVGCLFAVGGFIEQRASDLDDTVAADHPGFGMLLAGGKSFGGGELSRYVLSCVELALHRALVDIRTQHAMRKTSGRKHGVTDLASRGEDEAQLNNPVEKRL